MPINTLAVIQAWHQSCIFHNVSPASCIKMFMSAALPKGENNREGKVQLGTRGSVTLPVKTTATTCNNHTSPVPPGGVRGEQPLMRVSGAFFLPFLGALRSGAGAARRAGAGRQRSAPSDAQPRPPKRSSSYRSKEILCLQVGFSLFFFPPLLFLNCAVKSRECGTDAFLLRGKSAFLCLNLIHAHMGFPPLPCLSSMKTSSLLPQDHIFQCLALTPTCVEIKISISKICTACCL